LPGAAFLQRCSQHLPDETAELGFGRPAQAAAEAGCDAIAVQGTEAGGHIRGQISLLPLLETVTG
jgi:NAD(P)H-dependent flavin oxidoreductase YrpB (nitropropane dioxygenase family)